MNNIQTAMTVASQHIETLAEAADIYRENILTTRPSLLKSLANGLKEAVKDHDGRWLYELLQNTEDAKATTCEFILTDRQLVISDNGEGIPSSAIESLCSPYITTKEAEESIGQKGIGFCSVYELTDSPTIWSKNSGITFCKNKTDQLISEIDELSTVSSPYLHTLLPFSLVEPPLLIQNVFSDSLHIGTKLLLLLDEGINEDYISKQFEDLDPRFLLNFSNLKQVTFTVDNDLKFSLVNSKQEDADDIQTQNYLLTIDREEEEEEVRSFKLWRKDLTTPEEILANTVKRNITDSERLANVHTSIIFETTTDSRSQYSNTNKLFVYYPTEENIPLDVLIHGDFILDGSRKHLTKRSSGSFNHWLLGKSVDLLIETVNYYIDKDEANFAFQLIRLAGSTEDSNALIDRIEENFDSFKNRVLSEILVPTIEGTKTTLREVIFPSSNLPYREDALALIRMAYPNKKLASDDLCTGQLYSAVSAYSDSWLREANLLSKLKSPPASAKLKENLIPWSISAWKWLSNGFEEESQFSSTPSYSSYQIIPTPDDLLTASGSSALPCIVEEENDLDQIPDWLEVSALPIPLMHWLRSSSSLTKQLREKLGIKTFSEKFVVKAFSQALSSAHYTEGDDRVLQAYLDFAISRQWHLRPELEDFNWENSPISAIHLPAICALDDSDETWVLAIECYLGADWGNPDLDIVLPVTRNAPRVSSRLKEQDSQLERFLLICGAHLSPRLSQDVYPDEELKSIYWTNIVQEMHPDLSRKSSAPEHHSQPKPKFLRLNKLDPKQLGSEAVCALLRNIRKQWSAYFDPVSTATAEYTHYYTKYKYSAPNIWVNDLKLHLRAPSEPGTLIATNQLGQLWVDTPDTPVWAKKLFPRLLSDEIFPDPRQRADFDTWIIKTPFVKTQACDIEHSDWVNHIFPAIIDFVENPQLELDDQIDTVTQYYRALGDYYSTPGHERLSPPRIACHDDKLSVIPDDEPLWITSSKGDFHSWQEHIPVFLLRKEDLKQNKMECFQFSKLSDDIEQSLNRAETGQLTDYTSFLQEQAVWIFAYRSHENTQKPSYSKWRAIKLFGTESISVNKSIGDVSLISSDPYYFDSDLNTLYITYEALSQNDVYAEALIKTFKLPESDTDRIELLLGFDEEQRFKRLTKEMSREDYYNYCDVYSDSPIVRIPAEIKTSETNLESDLNPITSPSSIPQETTTVIPPQLNRTAQTSHSIPDQSYNSEEEHELHDLTTEAEILPASNPSQLTNPRVSSGPQYGYDGNVEASKSNNSGSRIPKNYVAIETLSRDYVKDKLERLDYEVKHMAQKNRGYDLIATRDEETLLIEVKGNNEAASSIILTPSERELAENPGANRQWQLWHVSNLRKYTEKPTIAVYNTLTPSACTVENYIVNLSLLPRIDPK